MKTGKTPLRDFDLESTNEWANEQLPAHFHRLPGLQESFEPIPSTSKDIEQISGRNLIRSTHKKLLIVGKFLPEEEDDEEDDNHHDYEKPGLVSILAHIHADFGRVEFFHATRLGDQQWRINKKITDIGLIGFRWPFRDSATKKSMNDSPQFRVESSIAYYFLHEHCLTEVPAALQGCFPTQFKKACRMIDYDATDAQDLEAQIAIERQRDESRATDEESHEDKIGLGHDHEEAVWPERKIHNGGTPEVPTLYAQTKSMPASDGRHSIQTPAFSVSTASTSRDLSPDSDTANDTGREAEMETDVAAFGGEEFSDEQ